MDYECRGLGLLVLPTRPHSDGLLVKSGKEWNAELVWGCSNPFCNGEMGQKGFDLSCPHFAGRFHGVEGDEAFVMQRVPVGLYAKIISVIPKLIDLRMINRTVSWSCWRCEAN